MKWTRAQNSAINIPVSDIIVSAAAGSGKTAVMAERIISRLTSGDYIDIDKILVVTYTNAAASEIKERVMKKIVEKLSECNDESLQKQLILINNSHFCTIHSFCLELIKKYFYKLGIDPSVKTGDPTELDALLNQAVSMAVNQYFASSDEDFFDLLSSYGNKKEGILQNIILDIYKFSRTMPDSEKWLNSLVSLYEYTPQSALEYITDCVKISLDYAKIECEKAISLITQTGCCDKWLGNISNEKDMINAAISSADNYKKLYDAVWSIYFDKLPPVKTDDANLKAQVKSSRDTVKSIISDIHEKLMPVPYDFIDKDNHNVLPRIKKLVEAVKLTGETYDNLKRENNLIDFADYEQMTLNLLRNPDGTPSDIAISVSNDFEEIYIDEYQDCNNIQNAIFNLISGRVRNKPNIFCVGDMKQSIYKFRDANPLNFRKKCSEAVLYTGDEVNNSNKILLNSNFRSRKSILDYVNSTFSQLMSEKCGELLYNDDESLKYGGGFIDINPDINKIDIDIINESNDFGDEEIIINEPSLSKMDAEVTHIAQKIKTYIDSGYMLYDKKCGEKRQIRYSDIVVLLRSPRSYTSSFEKIFSEYKIPVYCDNSDGYFETEEIEFLISLLKIIDNPDDDISLVSVMKNPVFKFDENELLTIRLGGGKGSFYKCINEYIKSKDDETKHKLKTFISSLELYHKKSRYMETSEFLCYLISDINYYAYLSAFEDSKLRKANVRFLIHKAKQFETNNFKGIFSFVRYIENIKYTNSAECAKTLGADDNVVRIMSIHKSKGLEFPVVFLSGLGKQYNTRDINNSYVIDKDLGIGLDSIYEEKAYKVPTVNKLSIKQKLKYEAVSEELRVLYVALTRPTEKLVITGTVKNGSSFLNSIQQILKSQPYAISPYIVAKSKCFLETLLLSSMRAEGFEIASSQIPDTIIKDGVEYNVTLKNISQIKLYEKNTELNDWESAFISTTSDYDDISKALSYSYPHKDDTLLPGNVTVTEIKKMLMQNDEEFNLYNEVSLQKPVNFASSNKISGNIMGTLIHLCMEKLDFRDISDEVSVSNQLDKLLNDGIISKDDKDAVDISKILLFSQSEIGKRLKNRYHTLNKEFSFKYMNDSSMIFNVKSNEKIIIQGTIDAFFEDYDGKLVLIDYKTDKVLNGDTESIVKRYKIQLDCYANALESILGKKVKEKLIYLFDTNQTLSV